MVHGTAVDFLRLDENAMRLLGARLREQRMARKLSADEVSSQALGYARGHSTVLRMEKGKSAKLARPSVAKLAAFYGYSLETLLDFSEHSGYRSPGAQHGASSQFERSGPLEAVLGNEGEDLRHDPMGWTSTRAHSPRYFGR